MNDQTIEKLRTYFDEMVVYKNLKESNFFASLSLPSYMRDWLLKKFVRVNNEFNKEAMLAFVKKNIPRKEDWSSIKNRIITERERVKILAKVTADVDIKTGLVSFCISEFGLSNNETTIPAQVWDKCQIHLASGRDTWGVVDLEYLPPSDMNRFGKIQMRSFTNFCPYEVDVEYYKVARSEFTISEWIDIMLGAIDYNANGYENSEQKLTMLTRLLPFVEKRVNLIELAPKGTGKSYLFGRVSRFGWIVSGGKMTRAKLFYDISRDELGLVAGFDFIAFDEVQTINFEPIDQMQSSLKDYMESGVCTVAKKEIKSDAGVILCGNIPKEKMNTSDNMFEWLPKVFHESALIDRIHGFIQGWKIPRMNEDIKISGWALNSEYFCSILHELRDDITYRTFVDELIIVPKAADTRDTEAVKRIATAYLKLLFPNVKSVTDINKDEFWIYCLKPAITMRYHIKLQLQILDVEFRGKGMPDFKVKDI
ncbi:MAG: BREX system Lon protease-like protein BrxL [Christensenellaceae bacterium]|jgi:ATP-dependent Lon protease|nr:BREX system Lon protease-like protein BrxL [Christensenellaceae bacterium]